ncbi:hypothetical protein ACH4OX_06325 [Streptomyces roseolus]|uniref:hypothetical protein n=1 Tax=Streptomyces roseolus TaxID=67358 RepID=UPI0037AD1F25
MPEKGREVAYGCVGGPQRFTRATGRHSRPHPERAGTSIAFAAESAYATMLHDSLVPEDIHVARLIIPGAIAPGDEHTDPALLVDTLWTLHHQRGAFRHYASPMAA